MQDYKYMLVAIDEVISQEVAGVICMENYKGCHFPNGFKQIFDRFCEFWKQYEDSRKNFYDKEQQQLEFVKFQTQCRIRKEVLLKKFVEELKEIEPDIDYEAKVKEYKEALEQEDSQTSEMSLSIYPLLISLIRKKEEREGEI